MAHHDDGHRARHAGQRRHLLDGVRRNSTGPAIALDARPAQQQTLHAVPSQRRGHRRRPACSRFLERLAFPPFRISPGQVHGRLVGARECFAQLVASREKALAVCGALCVELPLFLVGAVILEPVALGAPGTLLQRPGQHHARIGHQCIVFPAPAARSWARTVSTGTPSALAISSAA
ncbi:hypothetical protein D3C86_1565680 [compost metagenome]